MRKLILFIILMNIFIIARSEINGSLQQGHYYSPNKQFSVVIPEKGMKIRDINRILNVKPYAVDFIQNVKYPMMGRNYSLEWRIIHPTMSDNEFKHYPNRRELPKVMRAAINESFSPRFATMHCHKLSVLSHPAYQCYANFTIFLGQSPMLMVTTIINYKNALAIASLTMPNAKQTAANKFIPWRQYNHFLNSIRALSTKYHS